METRLRIIECATRLFAGYGIRSVTMNEVARGLGISKRTVYDIFSNKEDLLINCLVHSNRQNRDILEEMRGTSVNVIDFIHQYFRYAAQWLRDTRPGFLGDLQKFHPAIYKNHYEPMLAEAKATTSSVLQEGAKQGFFRSDLDFDILSEMIHAQIQAVSDTEVFPSRRFSRVDVFRHIMLVFLRGIASPMGLEEISHIFGGDDRIKV